MAKYRITVTTPDRILYINNRPLRTPTAYIVHDVKLKETTNYLSKLFLEYKYDIIEDKSTVYKPPQLLDQIEEDSMSVEETLEKTGNILDDILIDDEIPFTD